MSDFLTIIRFAWRLRDKAFTLLIARSLRHLGNRSTLCLPIRLGGGKWIDVGDRVYIGAGSWIEAIEHHTEHSETVISIGEGTSVSGYCTITAARRVSIGRNVMIARYVHISDHYHSFRDPEVPIKDQGIDHIEKVVIGDGAWIGHGAVICPGVSVGRNAVIGANAVVRQNVPDHCVAAGIPARIIRRCGTSSGEPAIP